MTLALIAIAIITILIGGVFLFQKLRRYFILKTQTKIASEWIMLKVSVPKEVRVNEDEQRKNFQEMLAVIEPFYASLSSFFSKKFTKQISGQDHISVEIIAKDGKIYFYIGCPKKIKETVEKNILAQYPDANIDSVDDPLEYSIFPDKPLQIFASSFTTYKSYVYPLRTYRYLEEDPLNAITNSLSSLGDDETAGIQIVLRPAHFRWRSNAEKVAKAVQEGKSKYVYGYSSTSKAVESFYSFLGQVAKTATGKTEDSDKDKMNNQNSSFNRTPMQEAQLKLLGEKVAKLGFEAQIRIVTVARGENEAEQNVKRISSAFSQLSSADANGLKPYNKLKKGELISSYVFRLFNRGPKLVLNTEELASIFHLPNRFVDTPNIAWLLAKKEPPPANLPKEGTVIGKSLYRGGEKPVKIKDEDRLRHIYMIGKTGVGKTVLFQNMIMQDIMAGKGCAYLDPNGDAAEWILRHIPKERIDDVVYFNPADIEMPMGLNLLEWKTPEQKDFLIQEAVQMFYKLFDPGQTGIVGPQFEHWLRNAALTLMAQPDGGTLVDIPRLFSDPDFEKETVKNVKDPVVRAFWEKQMKKTSDFHKSEMLNYFTSKFGRFMTNDMMRNIIGQTKSAFDFRQIMDERKILICNLSKGLIGEVNAFLLGMIIVSKIAMGAFSRQNTTEDERIPFYLYVDEFQNFITEIFSTILSESRKYKLSLNITNQYIAQMDEKIQNAVIGNAGTLISFRVGASDAEFLVKEFEPLNIDDMTNIDKYNFYIKMLIDGAPSRPFNAQSYAPDPNGSEEIARAVIDNSRQKYGRPKNEVDEEIKERSKVDKIDLPGISDTGSRGPAS